MNRKKMFSGVFHVRVDSDGCIDFPAEWRHFVAADRTFYFAPTRCDNIFDLSPKKLYDMEVSLLSAVSNKKGIGDIAKEYRDESFKVFIDEGWKLYVPKPVLDAIGTSEAISLIGTMRKITVCKIQM